MREFLFNYGWMVIVAAAFAGYCVWTYKKFGKEKLLLTIKATAYALMLQAERQFGRNEGTFKFSWVVNNLYAMFPDTLKSAIDEEQVNAIVQSWYDEAKERLGK